MKYDFDKPIVRRGTGCYKWDEEPAEGVIPMWVADMDFETAPAIRQALQRRVEHGVFGYTLVQDDYYEAIVSWFSRRHGWLIDRRHILYTSGVVPAIACVLKALTMPGEQVLVLTPVYNCFFSCLNNSGCTTLASKLLYHDRTYTVDWDDFERKCSEEKTTLFLLCNPHNPAGRVWTASELRRMNDICRRHGVRVVSDEIHCELTMPGHTFCPMATLSDEAIVLNSPSKAFNTAGLQVANIVCADDEVRRRIDRAININEVCDVNPFGPAALVAAYNGSEEWLDALRQYLYDNYLALCDYCSQAMPSLGITRLEGTYLVWVDIRPLQVAADELTRRLLQEAKVQVNSGTMYGTDGFLRLNIACPRAQLMEGLRRMASLLNEK